MDMLFSMTGVSTRLAGGGTACENQAVADTCPAVAG